MDVKRSGSQPSAKGPAEWFTGTVRIDPLFDAPLPARASGGSVTFEPGARTASPRKGSSGVVRALPPRLRAGPRVRRRRRQGALRLRPHRRPPRRCREPALQGRPVLDEEEQDRGGRRPRAPARPQHSRSEPSSSRPSTSSSPPAPTSSRCRGSSSTASSSSPPTTPPFRRRSRSRSASSAPARSGVEFATLYSQLGVKVTLLEGLDRLVPLEDEEISKEMLASFKKAGIDCRVGVKVKGAKKARDGVSVDTEQGEVWARQLLVAVGRAPRSKDIGLGEGWRGDAPERLHQGRRVDAHLGWNRSTPSETWSADSSSRTRPPMKA